MIIWHIAILAAYFVKGLAGFGNSLIHTGVMAFFLENSVITPVDLLLTLPANIAMMWKHRAHLIRRIWLPAALISAIFLVPGALLLRNLNGRIIKLIFGAVVIAISLDLLRNKDQTNAAPTVLSRVITWIMIVLSGILSGMFGVGALMAAAMGKMTGSSRELKANMSAVYSLNDTFRVIIYSLTGLLTWPRVLQALTLFPAMAVGLFLGMKCAGKLSERSVRLCIVVVLAASGLMLIINNL